MFLIISDCVYDNEDCLHRSSGVSRNVLKGWSRQGGLQFFSGVPISWISAIDPSQTTSKFNERSGKLLKVCRILMTKVTSTTRLKDFKACSFDFISHPSRDCFVRLKFTSRSRRKAGTGSSPPCCCGPAGCSGRTPAGCLVQGWKVREVEAELWSVLDFCLLKGFWWTARAWKERNLDQAIRATNPSLSGRRSAIFPHYVKVLRVLFDIQTCKVDMLLWWAPSAPRSCSHTRAVRGARGVGSQRSSARCPKLMRGDLPLATVV